MLTLAHALLAAAALAADLPPLAGRWVCKTELMTVTSVLLPDGRYFSEVKVGDAVVPERGKWSAKDGKVTLDPQGDKAATFPFALDGDTLAVTTPSAVLRYTRVNTGKEVAAEAEKADRLKAAEDAAWRKRLPVAAMTVQPKHVAAGGVPDDRNVKRVFDAPDVFASEQLYLRTGVEEYVAERGVPAGRFKTYFHWHFLPTGRVYVDAETYTGAVLAPRAMQGAAAVYYLAGKTEQKKFGRYRVDKDEVAVEMDDGEKVAMTLVDGRRNLAWGKTVYGNVTWELEALKAATGK